MAGSTVEPKLIDAGAERGSVPAGCATRAVWEAVMQGMVEVAVQAYEDLSAPQRERVLEESTGLPGPTRASLVEVLRQARDFAGAARLLEADGAHAAAAPLLEQAGALRPAAEAWLRAGERGRAAAAFERAGALERALELYQALDARESMAQCLTRLHRPLEAAGVYRELGNAHAELESLRAVEPGHPGRREAVLRMSALLDAMGGSWRALVLLADALQESPQAREDGALQAEHARLMRHLGLDAAESEHAPPPPPDGYNYLKAIPIFSELRMEDMKDLFHLAQQVLIPQDTTVVEKGALGPGLLVLLDGTVDVYSSAPGADARLLNMLGPGAFLGEISLILDGPTSAHVRARTPVRALRVTRVDFQHYLDTHEAAALRIYRLFTENLAERVRALSA
jgi:tetratricopeptide (TPR) repeat protein